MGSAGCVGYLFERKGLFSVDAKGTDEDKLTEIALEAGADDMKRSGSHFEITCDPAVFNQVQENLQKAGVKTENAEITQLAKVPADVSMDDGKKVLRLMDAIDDHDDVQAVYSNINVTDELVAEMAKE
jgi:transcriptional/translational regulatory protein YebC/TACO1